MKPTDNRVYLLECSDLEFDDKLTCTSLQGILNRSGPLLFIDYGFYDKLSDRTTNEEFINDQLWFGKFRSMVGQQDIRNLDYYQSQFNLLIEEVADYKKIIDLFENKFRGYVVWDDTLIETISVALMLSGLEELIIISPQQIPWAIETGLPIIADLRNQWKNRLEAYEWAIDNLFERCKPDSVASLEPGWQHPEFFDYVIQNNIFTYSLATDHPSPIFQFGQKLLLLLFAGPRSIRNFLFSTRLNKLVKSSARIMMNFSSPETKLATKIQKKVNKKPTPTIFGWHTRRDSELSFMLHLSANNLRLVPSHMAGNFSFHSQLPGLQTFQQAKPTHIHFDPKKIYLTFTLSDGDQLMMMNTGQLGNWYQPERGEVAFNWEIQPCLVSLAPALLEKYFQSATINDCLVAGPSGAGYSIQPLMDNLDAYTQETMTVCHQAGIEVITSYDCAPPDSILRTMLNHSSGIRGYLGGYVNFGDSVQVINQAGITFISNIWPTLDKIHASASEVVEGVRELIEKTNPPGFISVHLFAYRTTITDIYEFTQTLDPGRVSLVRGDQFLQVANQFLGRKGNNND